MRRPVPYGSRCQVKNLMRTLPDPDDATLPRPISDRDRDVYQQLACYCFDEAVCWPAQALIARELGRSRYSVMRSIQRLIAARWLRIVARRWSPRTGWRHNVYELLEAWTPISRGIAKKISDRGYWRRFKERYGARYGLVHTNREVVVFKMEFSGHPRRRRQDVLVR